MFLSKKLLLPCLAMSLIATSGFAGNTESNAKPLEVVAIQPQVQIQPFDDRAPEALHIICALVGAAIILKTEKTNVIFKSVLTAGFGYLFSKWFDNNVMN